MDFCFVFKISVFKVLFLNFISDISVTDIDSCFHPFTFQSFGCPFSIFEAYCLRISSWVFHVFHGLSVILSFHCLPFSLKFAPNFLILLTENKLKFWLHSSLFPICLSSSLVHFMNVSEYLTRGTTWVFIPLMRFLLYIFVYSFILEIIIIIIIISHFRIFHTRDSQWFLTGVWVTANLLNYQELFSVFWSISIEL